MRMNRDLDCAVVERFERRDDVGATARVGQRRPDALDFFARDDIAPHELAHRRAQAGAGTHIGVAQAKQILDLTIGDRQ